MPTRKVTEMCTGCPVLKNAGLDDILKEIKAEITDIKTKYNAHCANVTSHASADTTNDFDSTDANVDLGTAD